MIYKGLIIRPIGNDWAVFNEKRIRISVNFPSKDRCKNFIDRKRDKNG